jgi:hypothetical protein
MLEQTGMTTLDPKRAFFHVIDDHRWLAVSGCAWNLVGANAVNGIKSEARGLLPNVDVLARDCLLMHARSLIKFYKDSSRRDTDIILSDFGVPPVGALLSDKLENFEYSIEVHLLHLTDWRDSDYRRLNAVGRDAKRDRADWDRDATSMVRLIFEALNHAANHTGKWRQPFKELYDSSTARYGDKSFAWPAHLCEKSDVENYLRSLGL